MSTVETDELRAALENEEICILDVRRLDELENFGKLEANNWAHIPHVQIEQAFQLDPETFQCKYLIDKPGKEDPILIHCKVGGRGGIAQNALIGLGYSNTKNYVGGFDRWLAEN